MCIQQIQLNESPEKLQDAVNKFLAGNKDAKILLVEKKMDDYSTYVPGSRSEIYKAFIKNGGLFSILMFYADSLLDDVYTDTILSPVS